MRLDMLGRISYLRDLLITTHKGNIQDESQILRVTEEATLGIDRDIVWLHNALHDIMNHEDFDDVIDSTQSELREKEQVEDLYIEMEAELYANYKYFFCYYHVFLCLLA